MLRCRMNTTIASLSDLHLETRPFAQTQARADLVCLIGDIKEAGGTSPIAWARQRFIGLPKLFVPGNHDFYGGRFDTLLRKWRNESNYSEVKVLYNDTFDFQGMRYIGTTLWSDMALEGKEDQARLMVEIKRRVADFSLIFDKGGKAWTAEKMLEEHQIAVEFLSQELARDTHIPKVVLTHWPPSRKSIHPRFMGDELTPYFINDYPALVEQAALWLHGHTHDDFDYRIGNDPALGRVICHPRGYPYEGGSNYQAKLITIDASGRTDQ